MSTLNWVITVLLAAVAVYAFYVGNKKYVGYSRDKKVFLEKHPDAREYSFGNWVFWVEIAFGFLGFLLAFILPGAAETTAEAWNTRILYIALGLMIIGMGMDTFVHHRIILTRDGFFYEDEYVKFRSILKLEPSTGFFKPCTVTCTNNKEILVYKKTGVKLAEAYSEWKDSRKTARKKGKKQVKAV